MRLIGHLPSEATAATFSDYLYVQGISNEVESDREGYAVWIHSEDEQAKAKDMLTLFLGNPQDPKYRKQAAQGRLRRVADLEKEVVEEASRVVEGRKVLRSSMPYGVGALTAVLIGLCLAVQVLRVAGYDEGVLRELCLTKVLKQGEFFRAEPGLHEIFQGEFWRLFTPVIIHGSWLHLLLNLMWLLDLGSMIEGRLGTGRLGLLVVVSAVASNLGQNWVDGPIFFGMSGVVYALLGYVWMRGKYDPATGLFLHPHTVAMMLIWFVLCFTSLIPHVANGAHAFGLGLGVAWGLAASLWSRRPGH